MEASALTLVRTRRASGSTRAATHPRILVLWRQRHVDCVLRILLPDCPHSRRRAAALPVRVPPLLAEAGACCPRWLPLREGSLPAKAPPTPQDGANPRHQRRREASAQRRHDSGLASARARGGSSRRRRRRCAVVSAGARLGVQRELSRPWRETPQARRTRDGARGRGGLAFPDPRGNGFGGPGRQAGPRGVGLGTRRRERADASEISRRARTIRGD